MPAIVLYLATTIAIVVLWRKYVQPMSAAAAIVLVLLPFCFTGRALLSGKVYSPIDLPFMSEPLKEYAADVGIEPVHNGALSDLYAQMIPWQRAVRHALSEGEWPVWNPFLLCGTILGANMQSAPYDAVSLAGLLLSQPQSLTFAAAMAFFFAGFFTFAFARALGCGEVASLIAAAAYMFNAILAFFIGWPLGHSWTFLPFVLFAVRTIVRDPGVRATAMLTVAFVLMIFAGHPETVLHVVAVGAAYGIFELISRRTAKPILHAAIAGVVALLLTAIALLPFLSVAQETREYEIRHYYYATSALESNAQNIAMRAGRTFFPFFGGQPERDNFTAIWDPSAPRVGSIVLALALAALLLAPRKETWFFFALAVITLCAAFEAPPVTQLLHELPLFDIALNQRLAFAAAFALAILAGVSADAWPLTRRVAPPSPRDAGRGEIEGGRRPDEGRLITAAIMILVAVILGIGTWLIWDSQIEAKVDPSLIRALAFVEIIPLVVVALLLFFRAPARIALPLLLGLVLAQRTLEDGNIYPVLPQRAFYPEVPVLREIRKDIGVPFRIVGLNFTLLPDTAALYGLEDVRGYEAMTFRRLTETFPLWSQQLPVSFNLVSDLSRPFLSFLNVRYALATRDATPPDGWRLVMEDRQSRLFENTRALPRAFVPRRVRYEKSSDQILIAMSKATDFSDLAWITVPHYPPHEIANGPGWAAVYRDGAAYEIGAVMERDGWVVVSESKWRGWRAYLDGRRVETHYANHAFIGVFVPRGNHRLRLVYVPEAFTRGRNITLATLAALALFFALRHRFQKPRAVRV